MINRGVVSTPTAGGGSMKTQAKAPVTTKR
jgi:hypothetical protein